MDLRLPCCMEDSEKGSLRVWTPHEEEYAAQGLLFFSVTEDHPTFETWEAGTFLDRDNIRKLRDALNTHLGEDD